MSAATRTDAESEVGASVERLQAVADRIAEQARGAEQVEAYVKSSTSTEIDAYEGEIESLIQAGSQGIGIRVIQDGRTGFAWATSLDDDIVAETLAEARDNRPFAEPDEFAGMAEPDGVAPVRLDIHRPEVLTTPVDDKVAMAVELEAMVSGADPRVRGVRSATYHDAEGAFALATSTGMRAGARSTGAYVSVSALADDGDASVIASGYSIGRSPGEVSLDDAAADAVSRLLAKIGSTKPESGEVTLVLEPRLTSTVLGIISGMLNGETVAKRRTPFADRVGEQIGSPLLTIVDDPTNVASPGAEPYDDEGLATRRVPLLKSGVLEGFLHNTHSARRTGTASTASAARGFSSRPGITARALTVEPGEGDLESLLAHVDDGVLASALGGLHSGVNPVSGDFSVSVEGLRIRDGQRAEPIKEATLASTLQRLLLEVSHVGADVEWQPGGTGGVTLLIPGVTLSGR
ncbi:MAG: TldD/PmbA family protein [Acidimicrobiales bacterium]|nr:TldD/PmbA family protein [Acidimicrobiales bacterium]